MSRASRLSLREEKACCIDHHIACNNLDECPNKVQDKGQRAYLCIQNSINIIHNINNKSLRALELKKIAKYANALLTPNLFLC